MIFLENMVPFVKLECMFSTTIILLIIVGKMKTWDLFRLIRSDKTDL